MDAQQIKQVVTKYWTKKRWAVHHEVGLCKGGRLRADVLAISMGSKIVVIEVKSSVADFKADKKWHKYLEFADQFYFCFAAETWLKVRHLIPKGVGVFIVTPLGKAKIVQRSRFTEVKTAIRLNVITRMAYRSADKTLHERKSKKAPALFVAHEVINAIRAIPKPSRKSDLVLRKVAESLNRYV